MYTDCEVVKLRKGNVAYVRDGELVARTCSKCGESKLAEEYSNAASSTFGKRVSCKKCDKGSFSKWSNSNDRKEYHENYYLENREKRVASSAKYYQKNKEKLREPDRLRRKKYRERHIERERVISAVKSSRRRARKRALVDDWTQEQREATLTHFGNACALTGDTGIEYDHVVALATGYGGTTLGNMMPLRADLNISKSANNIYEWFAKNKERFNLSQERFDAAMSYMASLNGLSPEEYKDYVYACHEARMIS